MSNRLLRVNELMQREISAHLRKKHASETVGITITGVEMAFGDIFNSGTKLRTYEIRDTLTLDRGKQTWRTGFELRRARVGARQPDHVMPVGDHILHDG